MWVCAWEMWAQCVEDNVVGQKWMRLTCSCRCASGCAWLGRGGGGGGGGGVTDRTGLTGLTSGGKRGEGCERQWLGPGKRRGPRAVPAPRTFHRHRTCRSTTLHFGSNTPWPWERVNRSNRMSHSALMMSGWVTRDRRVTPGCAAPGRSHPTSPSPSKSTRICGRHGGFTWCGQSGCVRAYMGAGYVLARVGGGE
jgi:hypothetical protein